VSAAGTGAPDPDNSLMRLKPWEAYKAKETNQSGILAAVS